MLREVLTLTYPAPARAAAFADRRDCAGHLARERMDQPAIDIYASPDQAPAAAAADFVPGRILL